MHLYTYIRTIVCFSIPPQLYLVVSHGAHGGVIEHIRVIPQVRVRYLVTKGCYNERMNERTNKYMSCIVVNIRVP